MNDVQQSETENQPAAEKRPSVRGAIAYVGMVLVVVPIALVVALSGDCGGANGSVKVQRAPALGRSYEIVPTRCLSLAPLGRTGARVLSKHDVGGGVYVVADPIDGPLLHVIEPRTCRDGAGSTCQLIAVPRESCTTWHVTITPTGNVYNAIPTQRGKANFDCTLNDGTHVTGKFHFDDC